MSLRLIVAAINCRAIKCRAMKCRAMKCHGTDRKGGKVRRWLFWGARVGEENVSDVLVYLSFYSLISIGSVWYIGVGTQSTLAGRGEGNMPEKYVWKIIKMPELYVILAQKNYQNTRIFMIFSRTINEIPEFYMILPRKMPEFYIIIARKQFFSIFFLGGHVPSCPRLLRLWCCIRTVYRLSWLIHPLLSARYKSSNCFPQPTVGVRTWVSK